MSRSQHGLGSGHSMLQQFPVIFGVDSKSSGTRFLSRGWRGITVTTRTDPLRSIHGRPFGGGMGGAALVERVALPLPILLGPFYLGRVFAFENDTHRAVSAVRPANIMKAIVGFWGPFWVGGLSDSGWLTSARFVGYKKKRTGGKADQVGGCSSCDLAMAVEALTIFGELPPGGVRASKLRGSFFRVNKILNDRHLALYDLNLIFCRVRYCLFASRVSSASC
ncbi:hypothetical protein B0T18DRAFT_411830 [Schizothecium vesticola]|uniref:Uncharacterized protein n=1 Tax=Schizothecium vesticola TaxID=314040 RepID=A0AA40EW12_9PEZI|nr:hypothetical protein B0T18DRAFT_411830 [Schizothecium vesticola]